MTDLSIVLVLLIMLLCALFLLALEVLIPGISVAGFIAFTLMIIGVIWCGNEFGVLAGLVFLLISGILAFLVMRLMMRSMKHGRLSRSGMFLDTESAPVVHSAQTDSLPSVGDIGRTAAMLHPGGIALFGEKRVHVTAQSGFIEANTEVVVIQAEGTHIIVAAK